MAFFSSASMTYMGESVDIDLKDAIPETVFTIELPPSQDADEQVPQCVAPADIQPPTHHRLEMEPSEGDHETESDSDSSVAEGESSGRVTPDPSTCSESDSSFHPGDQVVDESSEGEESWDEEL